MTISLMVGALAMLAACGPKDNTSFKIEDAFVRTTPMKVSAGYFIITNNSGQNDVITGIEANWAGRVELHNTVMGKDDVMTMQPMQNVPIMAGQTLAFRPGSMHVMLFDLKEPLDVGETRKARILFQSARPLTVKFKVKPITYKGVGSDTDAPTVEKTPAEMIEEHHH
ncbi:MAG TPA: copper chaperone PCu(A)C [Alphaproteobacteria bacterium]